MFVCSGVLGLIPSNGTIFMWLHGFLPYSSAEGTKEQKNIFLVEWDLVIFSFRFFFCVPNRKIFSVFALVTVVTREGCEV